MKAWHGHIVLKPITDAESPVGRDRTFLFCAPLRFCREGDTRA